MANHAILAGKVHLYQRPDSAFWWCSTYLEGKKRRKPTKSESLAQAKDFAEDWYLDLRDKKRRGELLNERTFAQTSEQFLKEYEIITEGDRNAKYVQDHHSRLRNHLNPYFGKTGLSRVTPGMVQEYRIERLNSERPPAKSTMLHEIVTLRQVLKTAVRHDWLDRLPDLSMPYKSAGNVAHRAWFSPTEYKQLYEATRKNIKDAYSVYHKRMAEQLHDKILFMANTGIRPDDGQTFET